MNTFTLTYALTSELSSVPTDMQEQILRANTDRLTEYGWKCQRGRTSGDIITATEEWDNSPTINAAFGYELLGLTLVKMMASFTDTLLPWPPSYETQHHDGEQYRNGECVLFPYASTLDEVKCVIDCLRKEKAVRVSVEVGWPKIDEYRTAMIEAMDRVKKVAKATAAARQLIQAFRSENSGFADRSVKELFEAIGSAL